MYQVSEARPVCPRCGSELVPTHLELEDGASGWMFCWTCNCESSEDLREDDEECQESE